MATTGTPCVSRYSSVSGTSRIAFGPAQTTAIGVRASSSRSELMSSDGAAPPTAPRWTPPIPPVAKTAIPAAWAAIIVALTVVAAQPPAASAPARLGRAAFRTDPGRRGRERLEVRVAAGPTRNRPSRTATVAGTAPAARTAASDARATSTFCG